MSTTIKPRCELCADTGSLTTDGYLDCVACDTAAIMVALNEWLARHPKATPAEIFQHGRAVERIAADSPPKIKEGSPASDNLAPGLDRAARYLEKQADDYLHDFSSTEHDTGATSFHFGEAGREHHALLGELAEEIRALAGAAPVEAAKIPEGYKLVPIVSTSEMERAGWLSMHHDSAQSIDAERCWDAMLAAAPTPEAQ